MNDKLILPQRLKHPALTKQGDDFILITNSACKNKTSDFIEHPNPELAMKVPSLTLKIDGIASIPHNTNQNDVGGESGIEQQCEIKSQNLTFSWSPKKNVWENGPSLNHEYKNIAMTSEGILRKTRDFFIKNGFYVNQTEYKEGTATTTGLLVGNDGVGVAGGITNITKKTWNPFMVNISCCHFLNAKISILEVRRMIQKISNDTSQEALDIELNIEIEQPSVLITTIGVVTGIGITILIGYILLMNRVESATALWVCFGTFLSVFMLTMIGLSILIWKITDVVSFQDKINSVLNQLDDLFHGNQ